MNGANSVGYYHGDGDFCNIMVQRHKDNGEEGLECEYCPLSKAEAELIADWAEKVLDSKAFRFTTMSIRGWDIFLPKRQVNVRPLMSPLQRLIVAIDRHSPVKDDPEVVNAIHAVQDALAWERLK